MSLRRPRRRSSRPRLLLPLVAAVAGMLSACDAGPVATSPVELRAASGIQAAGQGVLTPVFGPETFVRGRGQPVVERRTIATHGFRAPFVLTVKTGSGAAAVASAVVTVDGAVLLGPDDFARSRESEWTFTLDAGATMLLDVEVRGAPGSALTVSLAAERAATRFCPTDVGGYRFLQQALAATDPGGTIEVCDGTHSVNATVDKAVEIVAEHPGQATLTNPFNATVLFVSAVPNGLVRIADLNFVSPQTAIQVTGSYDQVVIERNTFHSTAPVGGTPAAVQVQESAGPATTPHVTLRANSIHGYREGLRVSGGTVDIVGNTITASILNAITWRGLTGTNTKGSIVGNIIDQCGFNLCIDVWQFPHAMEVADNQMTNDIARNTARAIHVQGRVNVRRNRYTGTGGTGLVFPLGPNNFSTRAGAITISSMADFTPVVEGNTVHNAFYGVEMFQTPGGITITNNVFTLVAWGFGVGVQGLTHPRTVERNDIEGYFAIINSPAGIGGSFRCNWWGSSDGPQPLFSVLPPESLWKPFSTEPIANRPEVTCDPNPAP